MDAYTEAHVFVAAIRLIQHKEGRPPKLDTVCALMNISIELGNSISRKLHKKGIVEILEDPFTIKLVIADHLAIEQLPKTAPEGKGLAKELEQFQAKKKNTDDKIAAIQAEMARKKQDLFADLEAKFKREMDKQKKG